MGSKLGGNLFQKFIQNTLNNGPASDSDDWDEISSNDLASLKNFGKTTIDAPVDMNQTSDPINMSSFEPTGIEDTDLTLYFAEPNELERLVILQSPFSTCQCSEFVHNKRENVHRYSAPSFSVFLRLMREKHLKSN